MSRERGLGGGGAQTKAPRGPSLRPLRATVPGFSVSGVGLDRAAILHQHALILQHRGNLPVAGRQARRAGVVAPRPDAPPLAAHKAGSRASRPRARRAFGAECGYARPSDLGGIIDGDGQDTERPLLLGRAHARFPPEKRRRVTGESGRRA